VFPCTVLLQKIYWEKKKGKGKEKENPTSTPLNVRTFNPRAFWK